ncbi:MAG TPA: DUF4412 domain-containing protein [Steroidobacteraceae bacterium]|nr:DUF4412 domain-containing protein [Steroidobacteraceae bacterium]
MKRTLIVGLGALCAQVASAGVYVELVNHDIKTGKTELAQKMYLQDSAGRFVDPEGRVTLIKGGTMYIIDDADKSYVLVDKATLETLAKKVAEQMEQVKEQLAKLPPEQRAQMEQMIPGMSEKERTWTVETIDTGKSDKVDGRSCRLWDIKREGELDDQWCVVPYSALPGKEDFSAVFASFAKVFEEMAKTVPMLSGMMSNEFDAQAKVNGFPVRSRAYENGRLGEDEHLLRVWREEAIPAAMFSVPAGYKQKQMPMGGE